MPPRGSVVLGLSADYHDAAAAVVVDGELVAAAEEERFSRTKHDAALPVAAIEWCLDEAGVLGGALHAVAFYDKPFTTWERILSTHAHAGPRGFGTLREATSSWLRSKLWVGYRIAKALQALEVTAPKAVFAEHHQSHAAAAFYPSPFEEAAILTFDGVGEWATSTIGHGSGATIELLREQRFPDSLGLFYSAMTAYCGFEVNDGEYKLMGLAPYGEPTYVDALRRDAIHVDVDGSVRLDQRRFDYRVGRRMVSHRMEDLLDGPPRDPEAPLGQREADLARSVQVILEDAVLAAARFARELTGASVACLAGGVALNCVANARLLDEGPFDDLWIQPAAGDAGSSVGAALWAWHQLEGRPREVGTRDAMRGGALGPAFAPDEVASWLAANGIAHERLASDGERSERVAQLLAEGKVVGWFQGPMEFGPRALGHRSILADPRDPTVARRINAAVKGRESFRPFAPAVLAERADDWFDLRGRRSPYMLLTAQVHPDRWVEPVGDEPASFEERLSRTRSAIGACTHVDRSARVQTVDRAIDPDFHALIAAFEARTQVPVLLNTSFNRAGEPIVRSPADALRCHRAAGLDALVLEDCLVGPLQPGHADGERA